MIKIHLYLDSIFLELILNKIFPYLKIFFFNFIIR